MQSLFLTAVFASLMFMGFSAAFAAALGFIWVDIVKPQQLAYSIINGLSLSLFAAATTLTLFTLKDRKSPPKFGSILVLLALLALWVTFTTSQSAFPGRAWLKWDWASKVLIFAILIPFIFRSRVQIEAFILVFIFSASTIFFSAGVKTLLGGGGYGTLAIMGAENTGLSEGSTLALVCVMLIPLIVFIMRHTLIFPRNMLTYGLFTVTIAVALATVVGTTARTGIIAVVTMCVLFMLKSRKKMWWIAGAALVGIVLTNIDLSATPWGARMSTIGTYNADSSALGRLKVWEWTLNFVGSNPLGGGFDSYLHNRIVAVSSDGVVQYYPDSQLGGKAFHSIYFEMLGEQGIPGFIMYFSMILLALLKLRSLKKTWKDHAGMAWLVALADALTASILIFLAGGSFIGIAYQPYIFYMVSLTVAIDQYAGRVTRDQAKEKGRMKL
ncbi:MAG: putative O-glycosylation ligase, exosortase A system-associated [Massilia sp.]|nr:MAG: putative O-glycosylation ligase, exosortase A system-associated [Massilia sp.]